VLGIIAAVNPPSSGRADDRMAVPMCAQHVPIPMPTSMSEAAMAATGPAPIVKKRPAKPVAIRSGPSTITVRARTGVTWALRIVPIVHDSDWTA